MSDTVLVTGATGFIGARLVKELRAAGRAVLSHSGKDGDIARCELPYEGVSHVYHLAARAFVPHSWTNTRAYYETNVLGTVNVLEFCRRSGASLTFLSSYVYGRPQRLPIDETHPVAAFNPYGHSKILAEEAAQYYEKQFGVGVTIIRPFNIYGPGQQTPWLIPVIVEQAISAAPVITVDDDRPRRDYLYIDDFIRLVLLTEGKTGVFNAGSGASVSVRELVAAVNSLAPSPKLIVSRGAGRPDDVSDVVANTEKAKRELGWAPQTPLLEGLRRTMEARALSS